jgi:hypothetical protein
MDVSEKLRYHLEHSEGAKAMIARVWRGWTNAEHADAYERLLREVVYPGLKTIAGYRGGYVLHARDH